MTTDVRYKAEYLLYVGSEQTVRITYTILGILDLLCIYSSTPPMCSMRYRRIGESVIPPCSFIWKCGVVLCVTLRGPKNSEVHSGTRKANIIF